MTGPSPERKGILPRLNLGYSDVIDMHLSPTDHCLHTDMRTYASSPNSLYMYEQEKFDMQNSYQPLYDTCPVKCEPIDLKPEMEEDIFNCSGSTVGTMDDYLSPSSPWDHQDNCGLLKIEDVFQVDRRDVIQGPTLAELNCDESLGLFDDIESLIKKDYGMYQNDGWCSEQEKKPMLASSSPQSSCNQSGILGTLGNCASGGSSLPSATHSPSHTVTSKSAMLQETATATQEPPSGKRSSLHQLLTQTPAAAAVAPSFRSVTHDGEPGEKRTWTPGGTDPQGNALEQKWEEIRQFIHDEPPTFTTPGKKAKLERTEHAHVIKTEEEADSHEDDGFDSDVEESDGDDDNNWSSEAESVDSNDSGHSRDVEGIGGGYRSKKEARYFWQYNVQSKGPKGKRLCVSLDDHDPHVLNDFEDPVFDPELKTDFKHMGKARRGDGNDIAPSPRKLFQIGNELKKLNRVINDLTPVSELPVNARPRSRREKNKLASRACRMKKKAQHEANKVKLYGLEQEHQSLMSVISQMRKEFKKKAEGGSARAGDTMKAKLEKVMKSHLKSKVAGNTVEFVNQVLSSVSQGDAKGGLP